MHYQQNNIQSLNVENGMLTFENLLLQNSSTEFRDIVP